MTDPKSALDPPPVPPARPSNDDCCGGGCNSCVFDVYDEALQRHHVELAAWRERHPVGPSGSRPEDS